MEITINLKVSNNANRASKKSSFLSPDFSGYKGERVDGTTGIYPM
jgi:hypothetical protein